MSSIFKINLCGRKIYRKESGIKKYFFGTVIADYDFESEEVKNAYGVCGSKGTLLIEVRNPTDGWQVRLSSEAYCILRAKRIAFAEDKFCWWLDKTDIEGEDYLLDERKTMDNE